MTETVERVQAAIAERDVLSVAGLVGSLRDGSYNLRLFEAAGGLAPPDVRLAGLPIGDLPHYREDLERPGEVPPIVEAYWERVRRADALLIVTPEYNHSVPGVVKNALDWASRPRGDSKIAGKAAALAGASTGPYGTARAQLHLRSIASALDLRIMPQPAVLVGQCAAKFDADGTLTDAATRDQLRDMLAALASWTRAIRAFQS